MHVSVLTFLGQYCGPNTMQLICRLPELHMSQLSSPCPTIILIISDWNVLEGFLKLDLHMYFQDVVEE